MGLRRIGSIVILLALLGGVLPQLSVAAAPASMATTTDASGAVADARYFPETGHVVSGRFREVWESRGGLFVFGLPLTSQFPFPSTDGKVYQVQYFERAVFEYHPELGGDNQVQLSQLGRLRFAALYPNGPTTIDTDFVSLSQIAVKTVPNNYVTWSLSITNTSDQPLLSVLVTIVFYDANGNQLDTSIAGATNLNPGETRPAQGLSVKGLGYARFAFKTPEVLVKPQ